MRLQMVIDATKCMNCKACVLACQQRNHVPMGFYRNWIRELPVLADHPTPLRPLSGIHYQPGNCMQCNNAPCVRACPTGATYRDAAGVVLVNAQKCISCGACMDSCPYNARFRHPVTHVMDKCDFCAESRLEGIPPACITVCPTQARIFGDADDPNSPVALVLKEQSPTYIVSNVQPAEPTVAYVGGTLPTDWPREAELTTPMELLRPMAQGVRWGGGLVLGGLVAVALRQFFPGTDAEENHRGNQKDL